MQPLAPHADPGNSTASPGIFRRWEIRVFSIFRRPPPNGRVYRIAFWLFVAYVACLVASGIFAAAGGGALRVVSEIILIPLVVASIILLSLRLSRPLLWKVRNRLIVTYLLMGLAPIVLFGTLTLLVAYAFAGQFAAFAASSAFRSELAELGSEDRSFALQVAQAMAADPAATVIDVAGAGPEAMAGESPLVSAFSQGKELHLAQDEAGQALVQSLPTWARNGFDGVVIDHQRLFLRAVNTASAGGHTAVLISSVPLTTEVMDHLAQDLGKVQIFSEAGQTSPLPVGKPFAKAPRKNSSSLTAHARVAAAGNVFAGASGGTLPPRKHFFDLPVAFPAPLNVVDWQTGEQSALALVVTSRPSLLYRRLFATSFSHFEATVEIILSVAAIFFCLLEVITVCLAIRLSRTITQSVDGLSRATEEIDRGNLQYRIPVRRQDQLAVLSASFNRMAASLDRLLVEQREKQRLENELAIAREVQENLFPSREVALGVLDVHGVCQAARAVSGDYYDFLALGPSRMLLALGDISGKGISAALLMATLHSAVRAYRSAGDHLEQAIAPHGENSGAPIGPGVSNLFRSPGKLLEMLNGHLYRSTQPEKYATLFLAHYDAATHRLIYANGGHIPPVLLSADGAIRRLDCGGTVVGLMDGVRYEQGSVPLESGDLLIAYSDGVSEAENQLGEFGEERLIEVIKRNRHRSLEVISSEVLKALHAWLGDREQPDDVTLMLARRTVAAS